MALTTRLESELFMMWILLIPYFIRFYSFLYFFYCDQSQFI